MKNTCLFLVSLLVGAAWMTVSAEDWPTYRRDAARSGYTPEKLPDQLEERWVFRTRHAPRPAWPRSQRMTFDRAPQPIVAEGRVFFGDSVDGRIVALDAERGSVEWRFPTRAPIRFAPAWREGRLYAVSDDGHLYCLKAGDGSLLWKKRGGPGDEMSLGNGRMISRWPARGGAVILDDIVYFAAGIWPSDGVSLYALDPETGRTIWMNDTAGSIYMGQPHGGAYANSGVAAQGYLAANEKQIFMATGRGVPAAFDRATGAFQYLHLQSNTHRGGARITLSDRFFVNEGYVFDQAAGSTGPRIGKGPVVATPGGLVCSLDGKRAEFEWADLEKLDRKGKPQPVRSLKETFGVKQDRGGASAIVAGDKHVVGFDGRVSMKRLGAAAEVWSAKVDGVAHGLAAADQGLFVSTDKGAIHCFRPLERHSTLVSASQPERLPESDPGAAAAAGEIVRLSGVKEGYALDIGCGDGRLALELAKRTELFIYAIDPDPRNVGIAREMLTAAGLYGSRVMVLEAGLEDTQLPKYFANLVVSARSLDGSLSPVAQAEANRSLRPYGGVMVRGRVGGMTVVKRGPLEGAGEWTHQYANPANTVNSADRLVSGPLGMLWFADLEQPMTQRHGRGPAPLFKDGVLFSEGLDGIIAVDAYNGYKLWEYSLPDILKSYDGDHLMGTAGTGSNYCVTEDSVYVRRGNKCLRIDARTGKLLATFTAPKTVGGKDGVWGHIASEDGFLFGSLSNPKHVVTYRYRPGGDMKDQLTESRTFFALDALTGELKWRYDARHSLRHNGIAIGAGMVILIDRPIAEFDRRRDGKATADNHATGALVALNSGTGDILWRNENDIYGTVSAISTKHHSLMMSYQPTRFRLASEIGGRISAFNLSDGQLIWEKKVKYDSRPVINDRTIYAQGGAWDLLTGEDRPFNFKRSYGCGVLAGSRDMMVFRSATLGYFDLTQNEKTEDFGGIRPGCWINVIPAGGLVFAPDASAGCKCSYLNQSWIALQTDGTRAPRIEPAGSASPGPVRVALKPDQPHRETIRYTLDGTTPTIGSSLYREPFWVEQSGRLRARAFTANGRPSPVVDAEFVVDPDLLPLGAEHWRVEDAPGAKPPSEWSVENGIIEQVSNVMVGGPRVMENTPEVERPGSLYLFKDRARFADGELSFELNSTDDDGVGIALRYGGAEKYYLWAAHNQRPFRALAVKDGDRYDVLASNVGSFQRRKWHKVRFVFEGTKITGYFDGAKDFEVEDSTHASGTIGFYSWGNSGVKFRNVKFRSR